MLTFLGRRFLEAIPTLLVVVTVTFFLLRLAPGGPFSAERDIPPETLAQLEQHYGLDRPLAAQYFSYLGNLLRGDLGPSFRYPTYTVNEIVASRLPVSLELGLYGLIVALILGVGAGLLAAWRRDSWADHTIMTTAMIGICLPTFVLGPLLVLLFGIHWNLVNVTGWDDWSDRILPALVLGSFYAAYLARLTRQGLSETMQTDFYRTALAKGASRPRAVLRHALKPSLLPALAFLGPAAAGLLTGSFVVETIFHLPGLGKTFIDAAFARDFTLVSGLVVLYAALIIFFNCLVDLLQAWLDPRLRTA